MCEVFLRQNDSQRIEISYGRIWKWYERCACAVFQHKMHALFCDSTVFLCLIRRAASEAKQKSQKENCQQRAVTIMGRNNTKGEIHWIQGKNFIWCTSGTIMLLQKLQLEKRSFVRCACNCFRLFSFGEQFLLNIKWPKAYDFLCTYHLSTFTNSSESFSTILYTMTELLWILTLLFTTEYSIVYHVNILH